jgi:DNA-binding CsgD family transcriptional regulator/PAS domain-containing protein
MNFDDVDLIARIYDTALSPKNWPEVLLRLATRLGAAGALIFEVRVENGKTQIASRLFSANYDSKVISNYMTTFNREELSDQTRFAKLSAASDAVELISDVRLRQDIHEVTSQANIQFLMQHGLMHRAGALLNKDHPNTDRFSLQFGRNRGPITGEELRDACIFLPHVAKVIGIGRPLDHQFRVEGVFSEIVKNADQGIAILNNEGETVFSNPEFERIVEVHSVFRRSSSRRLQLIGNDLMIRFHDLLKTDGAHGRFGARPRKEALVVPLPEHSSSLFVEICPVEEAALVGRLGANFRLLTVLDSSKPVAIDVDRIGAFYSLSNAEKDVLTLLANGCSNQEIAERRNSAFETVKSQVTKLMRKTNSNSRIELVHMVRNLSAQVKYHLPNAASVNS